MTRAEHLAWCKQRALELVDAGDPAGAVASMISDLNKAEEPLYDRDAFLTIATAGTLFCKTAAEVRHWIEGFN